MVSENRIQELLQPFAVSLASHQLAQVRTYLGLLLRWNQKINLTAIRDPESVVTRHFGETLFIQAAGALIGPLLDIGSGAGFPGLSVKILFPGLEATLLEPIAKKRAFLKEVIRSCEMSQVEVRPERLEEFARQQAKVNSITLRAVGQIEKVVAESIPLLHPGGKFYLWSTRSQSQKLKHVTSLAWEGRQAIPLSREREIIIGIRE